MATIFFNFDHEQSFIVAPGALWRGGLWASSGLSGTDSQGAWAQEVAP